MSADATGIRSYSGSAVASALSAPVNNVSTSFSISPTTNWPTSNFFATIDPGLSSEEKIFVTSLSGGVLTVGSRGADGTSATSHLINAVVVHTISATDIAEANWIANTHFQTSKVTPTGADEIGLFDSAASFGLKKLTLTNLLSWIGNFLSGNRNEASSQVDTDNRLLVNTSANFVSGNVYFSMFTPAKNQTISQLTICNSSLASSGLTLARMGLYTFDETTFTLVARTDSDTSLFATPNSTNTRSLSTVGGYPSTYQLVAGQRYALAVIVVGTTCSNTSWITLPSNNIPIVPPRLANVVTGQSDLPTTTTSLTATNKFWGRLS